MMGGTELNLKKDKGGIDQELVREDWMNKPFDDMSDEDRRELAEIMEENTKQRSPVARLTRLFSLALKLKGQVNFITPMGEFSELRAAYGGPAGFCSPCVGSRQFLDDLKEALFNEENPDLIFQWAM